MTALVALAVPVQSSAQTYTTFDPPNSTGTQPTAINPAGAITGFYVEATSPNQGFVRAADGTITTFAAPGASQGTQPAAISATGAITGDYIDANGVNHGFLRAKDGTITTFDAPGAGTGPGQGTQPDSINPGGVITGSSCDAAMCHGFVRTKDGRFTIFDLPGSGGTFPASINPAGTITGNYLAALNPFQSVPRGFVRSATGAITVNFPSTFFEDTPTAINPAGTVAGTFADGTGDHYFLRAADGAITTFDPTDLFFIPLAVSINQEGAATGFFISFINGPPGFESFLRAPDGKFAVIADPNAGTVFSKAPRPLASTRLERSREATLMRTA